MYKFRVSVQLREGLHLRPISYLTQVLNNTFPNENVEVYVANLSAPRENNSPRYVNARSVFEMACLNARTGSELEFKVCFSNLPQESAEKATRSAQPTHEEIELAQKFETKVRELLSKQG
ncbi:HPr family phosphocarrier protein [Candidatus Pacearchaeota archaeon]|nr:MAG: HPr family phosphocarrier protein [Candidatus Pacearchaeota archaeon]